MKRQRSETEAAVIALIAVLVVSISLYLIAGCVRIFL